MPDLPRDSRVRAAVFDWLREQVAVFGDVLPWRLLQQGPTVDGHRVPLVSMQGIFRPRILDLPLTIRSSPDGPYSDFFGKDDTLIYAYRGDNPEHPDNVGLRRAGELHLPLAYFLAVANGKYLATWPVYVVSDDRVGKSFAIQVDAAEHVGMVKEGELAAQSLMDSGGEARRSYLTRLVQYRVHQRAFRERVLTAYRRQCTLCRFRHEELLDAAHIISDREDLGEPIVSNGLALCRLHHGAFEKNFIGIRPDYHVEVRPDLLTEEDGPTLLGIQGLHGNRLVLPARPEWRPDPSRLEVRFSQFLQATG